MQPYPAIFFAILFVGTTGELMDNPKKDQATFETKTMRQKLFESHFLHHSCPPEKEFVESFAFFSKSSDLLGTLLQIFFLLLNFKSRKRLNYWCGGHGMIGLLYVIYGKAKNAIILDRNKPKTFNTFCEGVFFIGCRLLFFLWVLRFPDVRLLFWFPFWVDNTLISLLTYTLKSNLFLSLESWKEYLPKKGSVTFSEGDLYDLLPTLLKSEGLKFLFKDTVVAHL